MMKILDYYYWILLRWTGVSASVEASISMTFVMNLFSLIVLFDYHLLDNGKTWLVLFIIWSVIYFVLGLIYGTKREEKIEQRYKDENARPRYGVLKVILYEVLSVGFFIWAVSVIIPSRPL